MDNKKINEEFYKKEIESRCDTLEKLLDKANDDIIRLRGVITFCLNSTTSLLKLCRRYEEFKALTELIDEYYSSEEAEEDLASILLKRLSLKFKDDVILLDSVYNKVKDKIFEEMKTWKSDYCENISSTELSCESMIDDTIKEITKSAKIRERLRKK